MSLRAVGAAGTHVGMRRKRNEDAFLVDDTLGLFAVADGMGGHAAGEVASAKALEAFLTAVEAKASELHRVRRWFTPKRGDDEGQVDLGPVTRLLEAAVQEANRQVWELSRTEAEYAGMGCTLTAVAVLGRKAVMVHVGDSRLYLVRSGEAHQLSSDHNLMADLIRAGRITAAKAKEHPLASALLKAVGPQQAITADSLVFDVLPSDTLLLCSDGLHDYLEEQPEEWLGITCSATDLEGIPDRLIAFANEQGGKDNVTAVLARVEVVVDPGGHDPDVVAKHSTDVQLAIGAVRAAFLFRDLKLSQVARVLTRCEVVAAKPGEVIIREDEPLDRLILVVSGRLAVRSAEGAAREVGEQGHLGADTLLRSRAARADVVAIVETRMLVLGSEAFDSMTHAQPRLGVALLRRLGQSLADSPALQLP